HVAPGLRTTIAGALGVDEDTAVRVLAYWTGLHDVGKIDAFFQANRLGLTIPDGYLQAEGSSHGHATLGCQWLSMVLPETGYPPLDDEDPSPDWSLNSSVATTGATPNPRRNNSTPVSTTGSPKTHGTVSVTPTSTASGTSWTPRQLRPAWTHPPPSPKTRHLHRRPRGRAGSGRAGARRPDTRAQRQTRIRAHRRGTRRPW